MVTVIKCRYVRQLGYRLFLSFFLSQIERNFYHFGTKFLKFKLTMPIYLVAPSIRFKSLLTKFPDNNELNFIQLDMERFVSLFDEDEKQKNYESSLRFHSITENNNNYVLLPGKQKNASELNMNTLKDWGLFTSGTERRIIHPCNKEDHCQHQCLLPFHKTNRDLLCYYEILGEDSKTADTVRDHELLLQVQRNLVSHLKTKFYCSGLPFGQGENYRDQKIDRVYYRKAT